MPKLALRVPETYKAIERPVAMDIAKRLAEISGIKTPIIISFPGHDEQMPLFDSRIGQDVNADSAMYRNRPKFSITVAENYAEGSELTTIVRSANAPILFSDEPLGIYLYPVYSETEVRMSFTYRTADKREAEVFRDQYRVKLAEGVRELIFSANYELVIPKEFIMTLKTIHGLREKQAGYGETWAQWMNKNLSPKSTVLATLSGGAPVLAFKEEQVGIQGYWEFDLPPELSKGENGSTYELTMDFTYRYEKPIMFVMEYPIIVHNQLLPARYIPEKGNTYYSRLLGTKDRMNESFDMFRKLSGYWYNTLDGIVQPFIDEFVSKVKNPAYFNVLTTRVRVDPANPHEVINLSQLSPYSLSQSVIDALLFNLEYVGYNYCGPFVLQLYEDGVPCIDGTVTMDSDLNVRSTIQMDVRKNYHLGVSLLTDPSKMNALSTQMLLEHPNVCMNYIDTLRPLANPPQVEVKVIANRLVHRAQYWEFVRSLRTVHAMYRNNIWQSWNLVELCTVVTQRRE